MKDLLMSRKFWALVIGLIVLLIASLVIPGFQLNIEQAVSFTIIVVSYIVGVAVDPGPGGWRGVILSRKFWAAIVGLIVLVLDSLQLKLPLGLSSETMILIAVTIGGYIAAVAVEKPR